MGNEGVPGGVISVYIQFAVCCVNQHCTLIRRSSTFSSIPRVEADDLQAALRIRKGFDTAES